MASVKLESSAPLGPDTASADPAGLQIKAEPSDFTPRRSRREAKSRLVYIKGQAVLRSNCYDLENGEPSVFDRELAQAGLGNTLEYSTEAPKKRPPKAGKHAVKTGPKPEQADTPLLTHNRKLKSAKEASLAQRALYLSQHTKVIRPFMNQKAFAALQARAAAAPHITHQHAVEKQPEAIKAEMRDYQLASLSWISQMYSHGVNCILGDEMGLGKTLQAIAFLAHLRYGLGVDGPFLVVVPLSVVSSWMQELSKWCPSLKAIKLHSCDANEVKRLRKEVFTSPDAFDVAVTTYEMAHSREMAPLIRGTFWRVMILDEGHRIKNEQTLLAQALRLVRNQFCLLLTGTPLQNNLHELYALLSFLLPDVFTDSAPFDAAFNLTENQVDNAKLVQAHHVMQLLSLRRLKANINLHLPPKLETRINCPLTEMQLFWYQRLLLKNSNSMLKMLGETSAVKYNEESNDWKKLQMLLAQLRKCTNHPYLFNEAEPEFDGTTGEDIVQNSGKMQVLDRILAKLKDRGHRVVLFSQFNRQLDIIEDYLAMRGYRYLRLDGSTNRIQRKIDISLFNREGSQFFIYILNTRAGGLGINLQTADTAILYDSDWNPQVDIQAMARVHRIGQTKPVHIYRLYSGNTIEERVQMRADKKLYLDKMVNRDMEDDQTAEKMDVKEILNMLQFGADRIFQGNGGQMPTDRELDVIMDRSSMPQEGKEGEAKFCGAEAGCLKYAKHSAADFGLQGVNQLPISSYVLNGKDYREMSKASMGDLAKEWNELNRNSRSRSSTIVMIDGYAVTKSSIEDQKRVQAWNDHHTGKAPMHRREKRLLSGGSYYHSSLCQVCWDGGELYLCDNCPAAYHAECVGSTPQAMESARLWSCAHHACSMCDRRTAQAGGMLLRCEGCANAYCEDCLPESADIIGESERLNNLQYAKPSSACYIRCDSTCVAWCTQAHFEGLGVDGYRQPKSGRQFSHQEVDGQACSKD